MGKLEANMGKLEANLYRRRQRVPDSYDHRLAWLGQQPISVGYWWQMASGSEAHAGYWEFEGSWSPYSELHEDEEVAK